MALNAYLSLKGIKSGDIKGSVTQKGREGKIMVIAANHHINSPRDLSSGLAINRRLHKPLIITKEVDKSSPVLYNVLCTNENLSEVLLEFWQASVQGARAGAGTETKYYTIKLTNAHIVDISLNMLNNKNPELVRYAEYEEVAFVYEKIEWTFVTGGITASDSVV